MQLVAVEKLDRKNLIAAKPRAETSEMNADIGASAAKVPFVRTADGQAFTSQGRLSEKAVLWPLYGKGLLRGRN